MVYPGALLVKVVMVVLDWAQCRVGALGLLTLTTENNLQALPTASAMSISVCPSSRDSTPFIVFFTYEWDLNQLELNTAGAGHFTAVMTHQIGAAERQGYHFHFDDPWCRGVAMRCGALKFALKMPC